MVFPAMDVSNLASAGSPAAAMEGVNFVSRVLAGRVTMVGLFHRQFGYSMLPSWTEPFEEAFEQPGQSERGVCVCVLACAFLLQLFGLALARSQALPFLTYTLEF